MESISLHRRQDSFHEVVNPFYLLKRYASLFIALAFFYGIIALLIIIALTINGGNFSYSLDDTFIHMAIAKHLVVNGVWGVTPYEFSSSSSSPIYTLTLAGSFYLFGTNILAPLIINIILATLLLILVNHLLMKQYLSKIEKVIAMAMVILFMPLPILTVMGMEHVLHTLITIWFVYFAAKTISKSDYSTSNYLILIVSGIILASSRYEGLFIVIPVCILFACRGKFFPGLIVGLAALIPLIIYGIISVKAGSYWLPNSVLLKGHEVSLLSFKGIQNLYQRPLSMASEAPWLFTLTLLVFTMGIVRHILLKLSVWNSGQLMIFIFLVAVFLHLEFAKVGWAYRYEAYLMALGILLLGMFSKETFAIINERLIFKQKIAAIIVIVTMAIPIVARGIISIIHSPIASKNIYEQQYQMGRFLKTYYNKQSVMAADIGAINFLADLSCIDIMGLGSIEVAKAKRDGNFNQQFVRDIAIQKSTRIAIVYDHEFFSNQAGWKKIAQWKIQNNKVAACDKVTFYAVNTDEADNLTTNLHAFEHELPSTVRVTYY